MLKDKLTCFVIMPFSETIYSKEGNEIHISSEEWRFIFKNWIKKAVESFDDNIICKRSPESPGNFVKGIIDDIYKSSITIADLTGQKPNVYYELGIRHALKNGTIIISQDYNALPSDLKSYYCFEYKYSSNSFEYDLLFAEFEEKIHKHIKSIIDSNFDNDNPVSDFLLKEEEKDGKFSSRIDSIRYLGEDNLFVEEISENNEESIYVKIDKKDILYFSAEGSYTSIHSLNKSKIITTTSLGSILDILGNSHFLRVHRNYIINTRMIKYFKLEESIVTLEDNKVIPIGEYWKSELKHVMRLN